MTRFIIQNKLYDIDKMEMVATVQKWYKINSIILEQLYGQNVGRNEKCILYRSEKGNWLLVHSTDSTTLVGEAITETEAKNLLLHHAYETYVKLCGDIEEA